MRLVRFPGGAVGEIPDPPEPLPNAPPGALENPRNLPCCEHPPSLHDDGGCQAQWGGYNDRQFCECPVKNPGNLVPDQGWGDDDEI